MGDSESQIITVRFQTERAQEIEARAETEDMTKSEFIRRAVARELGEKLVIDRLDLLEEAVERLLANVLSEYGYYTAADLESREGPTDPRELQNFREKIRQNQGKKSEYLTPAYSSEANEAQSLDEDSSDS